MGLKASKQRPASADVQQTSSKQFVSTPIAGNSDQDVCVRSPAGSIPPEKKTKKVENAASLEFGNNGQVPKPAEQILINSSSGHSKPAKKTPNNCDATGRALCTAHHPQHSHSAQSCLAPDHVVVKSDSHTSQSESESEDADSGELEADRNNTFVILRRWFYKYGRVKQSLFHCVMGLPSADPQAVSQKQNEPLILLNVEAAGTGSLLIRGLALPQASTVLALKNRIAAKLPGRPAESQRLFRGHTNNELTQTRASLQTYDVCSGCTIVLAKGSSPVDLFDEFETPFTIIYNTLEYAIGLLNLLPPPRNASESRPKNIPTKSTNRENRQLDPQNSPLTYSQFAPSTPKTSISGESTKHPTSLPSTFSFSFFFFSFFFLCVCFDR